MPNFGRYLPLSAWTPRPIMNVDSDDPKDLYPRGRELDGTPQPLEHGQFAKAADAYMASASSELHKATETMLALLEELPTELASPEIQRAAEEARIALAKARGPVLHPAQQSSFIHIAHFPKPFPVQRTLRISLSKSPTPLLRGEKGRPVGLASATCKAACDTLPDTEVLAVVGWYKCKSDPKYHDTIHSQEWEVVIPELTFPPSNWCDGRIHPREKMKFDQSRQDP